MKSRQFLQEQCDPSLCLAEINLALPWQQISGESGKGLYESASGASLAVGATGINRFFICESGTSVYGKTWVICKFRRVGRKETRSKKGLGEDEVGICFLGKLVWLHANLLAPRCLYHIRIKNNNNRKKIKEIKCSIKLKRTIIIVGYLVICFMSLDFHFKMSPQCFSNFRPSCTVIVAIYYVIYLAS